MNKVNRPANRVRKQSFAETIKGKLATHDVSFLPFYRFVKRRLFCLLSVQRRLDANLTNSNTDKGSAHLLHQRSRWYEKISYLYFIFIIIILSSSSSPYHHHHHHTMIILMITYHHHHHHDHTHHHFVIRPLRC